MHRSKKLFAALFTLATLPSLLMAQSEGKHGFPAVLDRPAELPKSTIELPGDIGVRAHTAHLILVRPSKAEFSFRSSIPVGETPGSLACLYQTSTASLSSGCPITGKVASGNNGLPNPVGGSRIIAIVDAYHYKTAYNDLSKFSKQFGLPALQSCSGPPVGSNCFVQVYATGKQPAGNSSWNLEAALDIEWAHAMAPGASIVLVEAASASISDLLYAVSVAGTIVQNGGGGEVSMSWGGSEFSTESSDDSYFEASGVVYFAAAGDSGGQTLYPSVSPNVVSAGGTTVNRNSSGHFVSETAWSGGGGGPSAYESVPTYQSPLGTLVNGKRGTPDFSFDANPNTGVWVYDSTSYEGESGWWIIGGTSVASPSLAGIVNLTGEFYTSSNLELTTIYSICGSGPATDCIDASEFRDITSGSAGRHSAATGWDLTTGLGSSLGRSGK